MRMMNPVEATKPRLEARCQGTAKLHSVKDSWGPAKGQAFLAHMAIQTHATVERIGPWEGFIRPKRQDSSQMPSWLLCSGPGASFIMLT